MTRLVEGGIRLLTIIGIGASAFGCAPRDVKPSLPDGSPNPSEGSGLPDSGVGTAVPEFSLTPGGTQDIREIFGIEPHLIETVGISRNAEKKITVTSALDAKNNISSQVILFNSTVTTTEQGAVAIDGFHFGGTASGADTNSDGVVDQVLFIGDGKASVDDVKRAMSVFTESEKSGLDNVLKKAQDGGQGLDINITNDGSKLTIYIKSGDSPEDVWQAIVPLENFATLSDQNEQTKLVSPRVDEQGRLVQFPVPQDWVEMGNETYVDPAFVATHEKVASSEEFTLMSDGTIQRADGTIVDGFVLSRADGKTAVVTIGEQEFACTFDPETIEGRTFFVTLADGSQMKWDGEKFVNVEEVKLDREIKVSGSSPEMDANPEILVGGAVVSGRVITDESLAIDQVIVPDKLRGDMIVRMAAFLHWFYGDQSHTTDPVDADILAFQRLITDVQQGNIPCSETEATIVGYDLSRPSNEQVEMKVALFCGDQKSGEGVQRVDQIDVVYVVGFGAMNSEEQRMEPNERLPQMQLVSRNGDAFATKYDPLTHTLTFYMGPNFMYENNPQWSLASLWAELFSWIRTNDGNGSNQIRAGRAEDDRGLDYIGSGFTVKK